MFTKEWLKAASIRAIKTTAQTLVSVLTLSEVFSEVNWTFLISTSLMSGVVSLLTSIAGLPELRKLEEVIDDDIN